jgi:2-C-methyl-D-erythritol 4-phosphate cytidylyltransferase
VKRADRSGVVIETVAREGLMRVQTPQAFRAAALRAAHEWAAKEGVDATDDAALIEQRRGKIVVIPGEETNIKVTTPEDLSLAEALLARARAAEQ